MPIVIPSFASFPDSAGKSGSDSEAETSKEAQNSRDGQKQSKPVEALVPSFASFPTFEEEESRKSSSSHHEQSSRIGRKHHDRKAPSPPRAEQKSAPSFTSFPDLDQDSSSRRHRDDESRKERKYRDRKERRSRSRSPRRHKEADRDRKRDKGKRREKDRDEGKRRRKEEGKTKENQPTEAPPDDSYRLFFSDRQPDKLNFQYGGLHQGDIPKYKIVGGGRQVLGLSPAFVVVRRLGKSIEIGLKGSLSKGSSISDSKTKSLLALPTRKVISGQRADKYQEYDGFIRIPTRRGKSAPEDTYRAITRAEEGDSTASDTDDSVSGDEEASEDEEITENAHQAHLRTLQQHLDGQPESVTTWISLLEHTLSTIPINSKNATKARCDIALSILSHALSAHPTNATSKVLRIKYLKAGEELWQANELAAEWEKALKVGGVELWMEWLEWRFRHTKQEFGHLVADIGRAFSAFQGSSEEDELARVRIFWRMATATRAAGFSERAFAMFQAQAELTFNIPNPLLDSPLEAQFDELEEFWESDLARVGEEGAKGWKSWYQSGKPEVQLPGSHDPNFPEHRDLDPYRQWSAQELTADRSNILPSRTSSETDDPFSTVLFSDIRTTLVKLDTPRARDALRLVFLSFLGLHLPGLSQSLSPDEADINWDDRWSLGGLVDPIHLEAVFPQQEQTRAALAESIAGVMVAREKEYNDSFGPVKQWGYEVFQPLDLLAKQGKGSQEWLWSSTDVKSVDVQLVRRVFSQLRRGEDDVEWDSLALAFEAAVNVKNAIKLSKAFLSVPKDTLKYWTAHAQLERLNGKLDGARKIYQTVLIASRPPSSRPGLCQMWWNWAEMEWLAAQGDQALNVILQSVGISQPGDVGILRAKQFLREAKQAATGEDAEIWLKMYALLELLRGADMASVLALFDEMAQTANAQSRQRLMVASLLLVYYYRVTLNNPLPPAVLRERAAKAFEEYPSNSVILGILLEAEKGQGIWGRVRGMLGGGSDGLARDVARVVQEVWVGGWEKGRWANEVERIRSGLAAAVEHERTRASPVVWRIYVEFEIRAGNLKGAKKLLFRAIGECPFVKELYLLAFSSLRSVFDTRELRSLADLMAERGLRMRVDLNEAIGEANLEGWAANNGDDDAIQDEIEYNAQELRRLMPY
ncbi:NRDE-2, necessary for RNA interference-domain-containing protein [Coprinopsis sp. MPI-PUGE-AT-0042]|nr:NRDE-2, necessary for RNA interference-domain-containing protein [Coprinopsis sp. MPI-PUGE-AT-0042]